MSNVKSIEGGKKTVKAEDICPHCGAATVDFHPAYSCPRIQQVSLDGVDIEGIVYIEPQDLEKMKRKFPQRFNLLETEKD